MPTCVYCSTSADQEAFTREHIVPRAFGKFHADKYVTLIGAVCAKCNQYFGDHVEVEACRGSIEGMHRYRTGRLQTAASFVKGANSQRVSLEITDPGWEGVRAYQILAPEGDRPLVMFRPQVVLQSTRDQTLRSYTFGELDDAVIDPNGVNACRVYAATDEELAALLERLRMKGLATRIDGPIPHSSTDGTVGVQIGAARAAAHGEDRVQLPGCTRRTRLGLAARVRRRPFVHQVGQGGQREPSRLTARACGGTSHG